MSYLRKSKSVFLFLNELNVELFKIKGKLYFNRIQIEVFKEKYIFILDFSILSPSYILSKLLFKGLDFDIYKGFSYIIKNSKLYRIERSTLNSSTITYIK